MLSKKFLFVQVIFLFVTDGISGVCNVDCKNNGTCNESNQCECSSGFMGTLCEIEFTGLCSEKNITNNRSLFLITFGYGSDEYTNKTPSSFGFSTTLPQAFPSATEVGTFGFFNVICFNTDIWHKGALDHTENDIDGYMYFVDFDKENSELFNMTIDDLCIGLHYEFSAYLTNVAKKGYNGNIPNIRFEVRTTDVENQLVAQLFAGDIPEEENMTWSKYALSFVTSSSSVILLMISNNGGSSGNDLAIDDIELHICSSGHTIYYPTNYNRLCHDYDAVIGKSLFFITFGSGSDAYSKRTPCSFNFSTPYVQLVNYSTSPGTFGFVNQVPYSVDKWHGGTLDHTTNDTAGYMLLIDLKEKGGEVYRSIVNDLCLGLRYEFSAYVANIVKQRPNSNKPIIRFEVRSATRDNGLIAELSTGEIPDYDTMTWLKYNLTFVASTSSVVLLMVSDSHGLDANDMVIDDIELRVCSNKDSDVCFPEEESSLFTAPFKCRKPMITGLNCNIYGSPCDMLQPCQNNGTCNNNHTTQHGFYCMCPSGFNGTYCQFDHRPCKPYTCLDHGKCNETSNTTFSCTCDNGWKGLNCESMINFCDNNTCENHGVCRPILLNYTCECLGDSYSGRHCEIIAARIIIYKMVSKSFAYVGILVLTSFVMFIVIMDILKYCFDIDPVEEERERIRRKKQARKRKPPVIQRFIYVNAPPTQPASHKPVTTIEPIEETVA